MSVNIQIYSNDNSTTKTINVDFVGDILAASYGATNAACAQYYYKFTTSAQDTDSHNYDPKIVRSLSSLALNDTKQSATNTANAYSDIKSMIVDYVYDYIYGHTANQFSSGVREQKPMKFN